MIFPPYWTRTEQIGKLLYDLDVLKDAYELHPIPEPLSLELRRQTLLKSSLYSARIEGNPLTWQEISSDGIDDPEERHKIEIANIFRALEYVRDQAVSPLGNPLLRRIHSIILNSLSADAGHFRTEDSAIFNTAGITIYMPPAPNHIAELLESLYAYCANSTDPPGIKAGVAHIWFEKIHPFLDGNGRVGRIIASFLLLDGGYDFSGIVPFEEYLDTHREEYYSALAKDHSDVSDFVVFFLESLRNQGKLSLKNALNPPRIQHASLLPRRREIVAIISEHQMVSFDFLKRRFVRIPSRTLHYDLSQLIKGGYVERLGTTRGALYTLGEKTKGA